MDEVLHTLTLQAQLHRFSNTLSPTLRSLPIRIRICPFTQSSPCTRS